MKSLLISAFLIICTDHILWAQTSIKLLQSKAYFYGPMLLNSDSTVYEYNADKLLSTENQFQESGSGLVETRRLLYSYDPNGHKSSLVLQLKSAWKWENKDRWVYEYEGAGNIVSTYHQSWTGTNWSTEVLTTSLVYDNLGRLILISNASPLTGRESFSYNDQNQKLEIIHYSLMDSVWEETDRYTFEYATNGTTLLNRTSYTWDGKGWAFLERSIYTYDANGDLLNRRYEWYSVVSGWKLSYEDDYVYNGQHKMVSDLRKSIKENGDVEYINRYVYEYDADGDIILQRVDKWNSTASEWVANDGIRYHYFGAQSAVNQVEMPSFSIFPNPVSDHFTLRGEDLELAEILNMEGKTLQRIALQETGAENIRLNLPSGAYLLRASDGQGRTATRVIVLKR